MKPLLFTALLLFSLSASADVIWLKNGDRLTGEVEVVEDRLRLTFPFGGQLEIPRAAIKRWRSKPGETPNLSDKGFDLDMALLWIDKDRWHFSGNGDINFKTKQNSHRYNSLSLNSRLEMENMSWRIGLEAEYDYDTGSGITTDHSYRLKPRIDYFIADRWFWRTTLDYQYDLINPDYLEVDYNSGAGYRLWKEKQKRLEFLLLGGARQAYWREGFIGELLFGEDQATYSTLTLGWDYQHMLGTSQIELFSEGSYIDYLNQASPNVFFRKSLYGSMGARYYFNEHLRLSWSNELDWNDGYYNLGGQHFPLDSQEWRQLLSLGASF